MLGLTDEEVKGAEKSLGYLAARFHDRMPKSMRGLYGVDDLEQEGRIVMMYAAERFGRTKGAKFETWFSRIVNQTYLDMATRHMAKRHGGWARAVDVDECNVAVKPATSGVEISIDLERAKQSVSTSGRKLIEFVLGEGSMQSNDGSGMSYYEVSKAVAEIKQVLSIQ